MDRLLRDLRVAIRSLLRHRAFAGVAILTLALGVGATTAIFSVVSGILLRPLPYEASDRLVTLGQTERSSPVAPVEGSTSHLNFRDWQQRSTTIREMALYSGGRAVVTHAGEADVVRIGVVTPGFFGVFRARPVVGREFTAEENLPGGPRAAIVSHGYWQERFGGGADVLSKSVEISGVAWPIVGVAPPGFDFPRDARLWLPVRNDDEACGRGCIYLDGIGRLADGASAEAAQQEMTAIAAALEQEYPDANANSTVMVQTLHDRTVGDVRFALVVLLVAVTMVLLIACGNVANLVLVRGAAREGELAVRTALGATPRHIVRFLLTESVTLAAAGGTAGLLLAAWGVDVLKALAPANIPRLEDVAFDRPTFVFALLLVLATVLLFGLGPSLRLSRVPPVRFLTARGAAGSGRSRWSRSALVVGQIGLSLVLLLGAGLLLRSVAALQRADPGFRADGLTVFTLSLPSARYPEAQVVARHEQLDAELAAVPGVTSVARISGLPLGPSETALSFTRPDREREGPSDPSALYRVVDADYFSTLRIPVLAGRAFTPADRADSARVVVVSRRMAEVFWPGEDPVGRPIRINGEEPATIVGIVGNVRSQALAREAGPEMYVPHAQTALRTVTYVLESTVASAQVIPAAREVVRRHDARLPLIGAGSMVDLLDDQLARPRFYLVLVALFAVLAVVLAAVGVYGVVASVVAQRTREIGVRMALGARRHEVVSLMLWQGLRPAAAGMVLGLAGSIVVSRLIEGLLYEVRPHDPLTFAAVTLLLLLVVVVACAIPAGRASGVDPADVLRSE